MSFPKPPDGFLEKAQVLGAIARKLNGDKMKDLYLRLKKLRTEALKRAISWRNVSAEYAKSCECCGGSGQYHYCINPYCDSNSDFEKDDCLHFTPHELDVYNGIRSEYLLLLREALELLKTGVNIEAFMSETAPKCPSEVN